MKSFKVSRYRTTRNKATNNIHKRILQQQKEKQSNQNGNP